MYYNINPLSALIINDKYRYLNLSKISSIYKSAILGGNVSY